MLVKESHMQHPSKQAGMEKVTKITTNIKILQKNKISNIIKEKRIEIETDNTNLGNVVRSDDDNVHSVTSSFGTMEFSDKDEDNSTNRLKRKKYNSLSIGRGIRMLKRTSIEITKTLSFQNLI